MKSRGIMLITTILMVVIVAMVVAAALSRAPVSLVSSASYTDSQRALLSIDAGLAYVKARFREDLHWAASPDSGPHTVVRTPDDSLVIVEDHGNVVGLLRFDSGQYGQFRIRFNHQDGVGAVDGLSDPSSEYTLETPLISKNNLPDGSPQTLFEDADSAEIERIETVAPFQAYVAIEGRAGPGLRDADPDNPNKPPNSLRLITKMAEARLVANFGDTLDAAAMAAGDINAVFRNSRLRSTTNNQGEPITPLPRELVLSAVGEQQKDAVTPRIRAKGKVRSVNDGTSQHSLTSNGGVVNTGSGDLELGTVPDENITVDNEHSHSDFYSLEWDSIEHATAADPDTIRLKAGTYVVEEVPDSGPPKNKDGTKPQVLYFDMSKQDYLAADQATRDANRQILTPNLRDNRSNFSSTAPGGIRMHTTEYESGESESLLGQLLITQDVVVEATGNTNEFNFLPSRGFVDSPPPSSTEAHPGEVDPQGLKTNQVMFQFESHGGDGVTFSAPGDVNVNGQIYGDGGAITSEGDIKLVVGGQFKTETIGEGGDGLSLYSKGDIEINSYRPSSGAHTSGRYGDLKLRGVIYAWGDIDFKLGPDEDDTTDESFFDYYGYLRMFGSVVAYGGDPGDGVSGEPGSGSGGVGPGKGDINISAHYASLKYDGRFVLSLDKSATPSSMDILSYSLR